MKRKKQELKTKTVSISPAKGRPMLSWVGKKPLTKLTAFPAQKIETFHPKDAPKSDWDNLLFHGDNKEVLAYLLENGFRGKINLIYIDPPFDSKADYVRKVELRGIKEKARLSGEEQTLIEQIQYEDMWANDNYLQFMYERLLLLKELLRDDGCIYLHCDHRKEHQLRLLLEEIFGENNYLNTISWRSQVPRGKKADAFYYAYSTHYIHIFAKNRDYPTKWKTQKKKVFITKEEAERDYMKDEHGYFRTSDPGSYTFESIKRLAEEGRIYVSEGGKLILDEKTKRISTTKGTIGIKYYIKKINDNKYLVEKTVDNLWDDIPGLGTIPFEDTGYPTQKTEPLLQRILEASTDMGDIVLDCFIGSGTTAAVAQKLGRRWIGCDINKGAIQTTSKRLQKIILEQLAEEKKKQPELIKTENKDEIKPASYSFSIYRVNDYDLTIQRNEAVNLAIEHIGIQRKYTDTFFDGTLGDKLVKIIPFEHPLTLLDLQLIEDELKARPEEERDIVVVCLGKETRVDPFVAEINKKRPINHYKIIELRTDEKYGKFFIHNPAKAKVEIKKKNGNLLIEIKDFISPTIIERLKMDEDLFSIKITDFRSMIDTVLIDTDYDGKTFNICYSDVPEKKKDLVKGIYELPAPDKKNFTVVVKIIDMLGEEVIVSQTF